MAIKRTKIDVALTTGTEYLGVSTTLDDQIKAEQAAGRHGWDRESVQAGAFAVWCALRRTGQYSSSYETFTSEVEVLAESEDEPEAVDPTLTVQLPGSSPG